MSSNDNPEYYRFYPYIKPIWERLLSVKCILIYVGYTLPDELKEYKEDIIMYEPIENIHTAFIAQNVRLLYPALLENKDEGGIMIADVDCIPMSRDYYVKQVENIDSDKFVNYSFDPKVYAVKEHNIPYCLAYPQVWKEIFKVESLESIKERLVQWNSENGKYHFDNQYRSKCVGFHFDQQILYKYIEAWSNHSPENKERLVLFNLSERKRLTKDSILKIGDKDFQKQVKENYYDDNFFLRPYQKKKKANDLIAKLLLSSPAANQ